MEDPNPPNPPNPPNRGRLFPCSMHKASKTGCSENCVFKPVFPKSVQNTKHCRHILNLTSIKNMKDFIKKITGNNGEPVPTPASTDFLEGISELPKDSRERRTGPYRRMATTAAKLKEAYESVRNDPFHAMALIDNAINVLNREEEPTEEEANADEHQLGVADLGGVPAP